MKRLVFTLIFCASMFSQSTGGRIAPTNQKVSGSLSAQSYNGVIQANSYASGGTGTNANPWTSASGTGGIQEAINAAGTAFGANARIHASAGYYLITTCINATANLSTQFGTSSPPSPLVIEGDGPVKTILSGSTGGCVFDITGRVARIAELAIIQNGTNKSVVGVLEGRSTNTESNFSFGNSLEHLFIELPTVPAANGGNGTVGVYNYSAEIGRYINNNIAADNPYVFTSNNIFSISSGFVTQDNTHRFVSQNQIISGSCTTEGLVGAQCILLQGHANNTTIRNVSTECAGATPPIVAIRIKAPSGSDPATDPLTGLNIENIQAECPGGQLISDEQILQNPAIAGSITNASTVPIVLLTTAASQLVNPFINIGIGNSAATEPLVSDGGVATGGILGGLIMLPATATISFTNASTSCQNISIFASYASPTVICNNVSGTPSANMSGQLWATDLYFHRGTGANLATSNTSFEWRIGGSQVFFCSSVFCQVVPQAAFASHLNITEIASPGVGSGGTTRIYADSTTHDLRASYNGDALASIPRTAAAMKVSGTPTVGQAIIATGANTASWQAVGGSFSCVNVTPVTVSANTATDQTLMACTIPAGTLNLVGKTISIQCAGVYSTPAASSTTVNLKVKLCTVSGCGSGTVITLASLTSAALGAIQATNDPFNLQMFSSTQTAGATSAYEAHGNLTIDTSLLTTAAEGVYADGNTATVGTIDSTAQLFLQVTGAFSSASASNSMTHRQLTIESIN